MTFDLGVLPLRAHPWEKMIFVDVGRSESLLSFEKFLRLQLAKALTKRNPRKDKEPGQESYRMIDVRSSATIPFSLKLQNHF